MNIKCEQSTSNLKLRGYALAQFVEAMRYKPEGRGFDSR
jgi:hypothetical protein